MEERKKIYCPALYSLLSKSYTEEKHVDVTIQVEDEYFRCHRFLLAAVSEYFDAMFNQNFKEKNINSEEPIVLHKIGAVAFGRVLKFLYTADDIDISDSNVWDLLFASDFFGLRVPFIEEQCVEFIRKSCFQRTEPLTSALEIFTFACSTKKKELVVLLSEHICKHFNSISRSDKFVEMLYDDLKMVLQCEFSSHIDESALLKSIIRWISHARADRKEHRKELMKYIDFTEISAECFASLFENSYVSPELADAAENPSNRLGNDANLKNESSLHVYVKHGKQMKVFSGSICSDELKWSLSYEFSSKAEWMRNIKLHSTLYRLSSCSSLNHQRFSRAHSVCSLPMSYLKNPPILLNRFSMCGVENEIYLYGYNTNGLFNATDSTSNHQFNAEELTRSVYRYNCESDQWFPVPPMNQRLTHACVTTDNISLYVIGSKDTAGGSHCCVMAYDSRTNWRKFPSIVSCFKSALDSFFHKGKIYVIGVNKESHLCSTTFDQVAGKWHKTCYNYSQVTLENKEHEFRLVSFSDKLFVISVNNFKMFKLSDNFDKLHHLTCLKAFTEEGDVDLSGLYIQDILIF